MTNSNCPLGSLAFEPPWSHSRIHNHETKVITLANKHNQKQKQLNFSNGFIPKITSRVAENCDMGSENQFALLQRRPKRNHNLIPINKEAKTINNGYIPVKE